MSSMGRRATMEAAFRAFAGDAEFSCLAGKGVARSGRFDLHVYGTLGSARSARALARDLAAFVTAPTSATTAFRSLVAVWPVSPPRDELEFERRLWRQLRWLHERDDAAIGWDPSVAAEPDDPRYAFSFAGQALFVIGLHPGSSRVARRFQWPALVFNPHEQFDRLRATGSFARLRALVRERELAVQGSLNPNLADFGERSEARQYSGRAVPPDWTCPFHRESR